MIGFMSLDSHSILVATLSSGKALALDPAGMCFGWKETISDWEHYKKHRVFALREIKPLEPVTLEHELSHLSKGTQTIKENAWKHFVQYTTLALQKHILEKFSSVNELYTLQDEKHFTAICDSLVDTANQGLTTLVKHVGLNGAMVVMADKDKEDLVAKIWWCAKDKVERAEKKEVREEWAKLWAETSGVKSP